MKEGVAPYGALLRIAGRTYLVDDREPPYGASHVDLYFGAEPDCERRAIDFGIQHRHVEIRRAA